MAITCTPLETLQERFPNFNKYFKDICIKPFTYGLLLEKLHLFNQAKTPKEQSLLMIIEDYRASIPNRLELLQSLVDEMRKNPRLETLKELKLQIHKLAGSAGLYGYEQVSLICKEFDERLSIKIEQFEKEKTLENLENEFENYLEKLEPAFLEPKNLSALCKEKF
ncbi:MAG: Hpt domain-containing protein [Parachlamydiaceae bacterium]|nr:MAG: Hpt domain-containing protein [Parachlamydiaceae bacterium]